MVEREKLSLCSSDGVRYLPGGRGERGGETGDAAEHPLHLRLRFGVNPVLEG